MKEEESYKQSFEQRLREAAESFEMQPSEEVWDKIKAQLPAPRKKAYFFRWAAAAVLLVLAGLGIYFLLPFKTGNKGQEFVTVAPERGKGQKIPGGASSSEVDSPSSEPRKKSAATYAQNRPPAYLQKLSPAAGETGKKRSGQGFSSNMETGKTSQQEAIVSAPLPLLTGMAWSGIHKDLTEEGTLPLQYSDEVIQLLLQSAGLPKEPDPDAGEAVVKDHGKLTVGVFFTPGMSYRTLKTAGNKPSPAMDVPAAPVTGGYYNLMTPTGAETAERRLNTEDRPIQQKQSWGWESGLRMALQLPKGWMLQTGLSLRQTSYEITAYKENPAYVNDQGGAVAVAAPMANSTFARYISRLPENNEATALQNKYLSTELPLLVGKRFGDPRKLSFTVLAGAGITYLLHSNAVMYAPKSQRYFTDEDYLSPFNSSLILETSLNVPLGKNIGFSIGPALQYQLFSTYRNYTPVREYPYLIGLKTAFHLK